MLSPIRTGELVIPALTFNGQQSQEIQVSVNELPDSVKKQIAKEFFFDTEVDRLSTYVQGQILYTEKLYYSINHEEATLSELKVTDAHVISLGDVRQYNTTINGQRMGVYERRYAIFAEESGEMIIPGQKFTASVVNSYNRWSRGRPVSVVAKPIRIDVKPTPANYPQAPWLPSSKITIDDRWSKPNNEWQVGEPVTRNITINAQGLSGSQLPTIELPIVEGLKYYPDQADYSDQNDVLGVQGTSQQSLAIVPTQSGRLVIPEMRIAWWNLEKNKLDYAILPAQTIQVAEASNAITAASSQSDQQAAQAQTNITQAQNTPPLSSFWIVATLFLLVSNLITAFFLWRKNEIEVAVKEKPIDTPQHFKQLRKACQENNPKEIRQHLKGWAQQQYEISNLDQLSDHFNDITLSNAIAELNAVLYQNSNNSAYNGQLLWNSLSQAIKKNRQHHKEKTSDLKPLYQ